MLVEHILNQKPYLLMHCPNFLMQMSRYYYLVPVMLMTMCEKNRSFILLAYKVFYT